MEKKIFLRLLFIIALCSFSRLIDAYSIVFIHIGKCLPDYLCDAIFQARLFNKGCNLYVLANQKALEKSNLKNEFAIDLIPLESIKKTETHQIFLERYAYKEGFWLYSSERFLYLNDFMQQFNIQNVIHLESDNMLYVDIEELMPVFLKKYKNIAAVFDNDERCIPGFVYIDNKNAMQELANCFLEYSRYQKNDMEILALFKNTKGKKLALHLPIVMNSYTQKHALRSPMGHIPSSPNNYSSNFKHFMSIFDGAAIGQYLGGIDPIHGNSQPGFINESCIFNPAYFTYHWKVDDAGRRVPYAQFNGTLYRINNLHIHSKNLRNFRSI